jgi:heme exporter protein A
MDESPVASAPAIVLRELSKRFGRHWALVRVDYTLAQGDSLLLTGPNGSGKTTLLRLIATAISPSLGVIGVTGLDTVRDRDEVRRRTALLSHSSFLYEDLTGEQNLLLAARLLGIPDAQDSVRSLLERVGLDSRSGRPVRQFSAGMRKRVAIAKLLLKPPALSLALLDEPFGELDPSGIALMERLIAELLSSGVAIVLATHMIDQGRALCRQRLHLHEGRVASP